MVGGYSLIDATGLDITGGSTQQTINGLNAALKTAIASGKEIILCGADNNGAPISAIPVFAYMSSTSAIVTFSIYQMTVTSADKVTIADLTASE